jgi:hypothetical protein
MWVIGLAALGIVILGGTVVAVRRFRDATRDSLDPATRLDLDHARRVRDWPQLRLDAVVIDPEAVSRVIVLVHWPAHPERRAVLTLEVADPGGGAHRLLHQWRDAHESVSPSAGAGEAVVLRRCRTNDVVRARVVSEVATTLPR